MSIIIERYPECDRCHETGAEYQADRTTVKELRKTMKKNGWLYRGGEDICPQCAIEDSWK